MISTGSKTKNRQVVYHRTVEVQEDHPIASMISSNNDQLDPDHEDEEAAYQQQAARHRYEASELVRNRT